MDSPWQYDNERDNIESGSEQDNADFTRESSTSSSESDEFNHDQHFIEFMIEENFNSMRLSTLHRKKIYQLIKFIKEFNTPIIFKKNYTAFKKSFKGCGILAKTMRFCQINNKFMPFDHECEFDSGVLNIFDLKTIIKQIVHFCCKCLSGMRTVNPCGHVLTAISILGTGFIARVAVPRLFTIVNHELHENENI